MKKYSRTPANYYRKLGESKIPPRDNRKVDGVTATPSDAAIPGINMHFYQLEVGDIFFFQHPNERFVFIREFDFEHILVQPTQGPESHMEQEYRIRNWNDVCKVVGKI